jgi:hypothetical protein
LQPHRYSRARVRRKVAGGPWADLDSRAPKGSPRKQCKVTTLRTCSVQSAWQPLAGSARQHPEVTSSVVEIAPAVFTACLQLRRERIRNRPGRRVSGRPEIPELSVGRFLCDITTRDRIPPQRRSQTPRKGSFPRKLGVKRFGGARPPSLTRLNRVPIVDHRCWARPRLLR